MFNSPKLFIIITAEILIEITIKIFTEVINRIELKV